MSKVFSDNSRPIRAFPADGLDGPDSFSIAFAESAARARAVVSPMGYEAGDLHYVDGEWDGFPPTVPMEYRADPLVAMDRSNERSGMHLAAWVGLGLAGLACLALAWAAWAKFVVAA